MKTKEQELTLLGLQEMNESERKEMAGGFIDDILGSIIFCCHDIPPSGILKIREI